MIVFLIILFVLLLSMAVYEKRENLIIGRFPVLEILVSIVIYGALVIVKDYWMDYKELSYKKDKVELKKIIIEKVSLAVVEKTNWFSSETKQVYSALRVEGKERFPFMLDDNVVFEIKDGNGSGSIEYVFEKCIPGTEAGDWLLDERQKDECTDLNETRSKIVKVWISKEQLKEVK